MAKLRLDLLAVDKASATIKKVQQAGQQAALKMIKNDQAISKATQAVVKEKQAQLTLSQRYKLVLAKEEAAGNKVAEAIVNQREQVQKLERSLRAAIKRGDEHAETLAKETLAAREQLQRLEKLDNGLNKLKISKGDAAKAALAIGAAMAAAATGAFLLTKRFAEQADQVGKSAERLGVTAESFQRLDYAMQLSGTSIEENTGALNGFMKRARDATRGTGEGVKAFELFNVQLTDSAGNLKTTEELLMDVADGFKNTEPGVERTAAAMDLFGESGGRLTQFLNEGRDGLERMAEEFDDLGSVISTQATRQAALFNDELFKLQNRFKGFEQDFTSKLLPNFTGGVKQLTDSLGSLSDPDMFDPKAFKDLFVLGVKGLAALSRGIVEIGTDIAVTIKAIEKWQKRFVSGSINIQRELIEVGNTIRGIFGGEQQLLPENPFAKMADDAEAAEIRLREAGEQMKREIDKIARATIEGFDATVEPVKKSAEAQEKVAEAVKKTGQEAQKTAEIRKISAQEAGSAIAQVALIQTDVNKNQLDQAKETIRVGLSLVRESVISHVKAMAVKGAAGAASNVVGIPGIGPGLAVGAATTAFALIEGLLTRMNRGGIVPGHGNTDTVPALLTPGELVIPKDLTAQILNVAGRRGSGRMNQGGIVDGGGAGIVVNINEGQFMPRTPAELDRYVRDRLVPALGRLRAKGAMA